MNREGAIENVEKVVDYIEGLSKVSDKKDYVKDSCGSYLKSSYLEHLIAETRELIEYGEYKVFLK